MRGTFVEIDSKMMTSKPGIFACGEITGCDRHIISSASEGAFAGMAVSEYLALETVRRGETFQGAKNGKYANEYVSMLSQEYILSSARSKVEIGEWGARYYDILLNLLSAGRYSHFMREVIGKMDIKPGQSILDLGSGTGRNDCLMAQKIGSHGKILGLDISDEMIRKAFKRCFRYANIKFEKLRIELPLAYKEEFDKVFISFVLHGFEDDQKVGIIRNAYQALKRGGTFHVLDYAEFDINRMWLPLRWAFARWECQLAVEFLRLDIKGMVRAQGFLDVREEFFLRRHLRLLSAVKPLVSTL